MQDFYKLDVWKRAHELVLALYRATHEFPKEELYGLTSQIRRSGASIPANLAEGCGLRSAADKARHFQIAMGSASELEYHIVLARDLALLNVELASHLIEEIRGTRRMLTTLIARVRAAGAATAKPATVNRKPKTVNRKP